MYKRETKALAVIGDAIGQDGDVDQGESVGRVGGGWGDVVEGEVFVGWGAFEGGVGGAVGVAGNALGVARMVDNDTAVGVAIIAAGVAAIAAGVAAIGVGVAIIAAGDTAFGVATIAFGLAFIAGVTRDLRRSGRLAWSSRRRWRRLAVLLVRMDRRAVLRGRDGPAAGS